MEPTLPQEPPFKMKWGVESKDQRIDIVGQVEHEGQLLPGVRFAVDISGLLAIAILQHQDQLALMATLSPAPANDPSAG